MRPERRALTEALRRRIRIAALEAKVLWESPLRTKSPTVADWVRSHGAREFSALDLDREVAMSPGQIRAELGQLVARGEVEKTSREGGAQFYRASAPASQPSTPSSMKSPGVEITPLARAPETTEAMIARHEKYVDTMRGALTKAQAQVRALQDRRAAAIAQGDPTRRRMALQQIEAELPAATERAAKAQRMLADAQRDLARAKMKASGSISESQLRGMIRSLIMEVPLEDLSPPSVLSRPEQDPRSFWHRGQDDDDQKNAAKIYASPRFQEKLERLMRSWPIKVWVKPIVPHKDAIFLRRATRSEAYDPEDVPELGVSLASKKALRDAVDAWREAGGGGKGTCLIIPWSQRPSRPGVEITPWMIPHGVFDTAFTRFTQTNTSMKELQYQVSLAIEELNKALEIPKLDPDSRVPEDVAKRARMLSSVFTMGSARSGYFTKDPARLDHGDMRNEAAAQALTSNGFRYDREALKAISDSLPEDERFRVRDAQTALDIAEDHSKRARDAFFESIDGKVITVQVS